MKLNNKGYMLVEVIVSFTLTIIILFFMTNATISLKNKADDLYVTTKLEADQLVVTKAIMNDINKYELKEVEGAGDVFYLTFIDNDGSNLKKKVSYNKNNKIFQYGKVDNDNRYINEFLFTKQLDTKLNIGDYVFEQQCYKDSEAKYISGKNGECDDKNIKYKKLAIKIPATTAYSDNDYGINIDIDYSYDDIEVYNPCSGNYSVKFSYSDNSDKGYELLNNNKIMKIKTNGTLTINTELQCNTKKINAALVGGGNAGGNGTNATWLGTKFGFTNGSGARGGNGSRVVITDTEINKGTYVIEIGKGASSYKNSPGATVIRDITGKILYLGNDHIKNYGWVQGVYGAGSGESGSPYGPGPSFNNGDGRPGTKITFENGNIDLGYFGGGGAGSGKCNAKQGKGGEGGGGDSGYVAGRDTHKDGFPGKDNTGGGGGAGSGGCANGHGHARGIGGAGGSGVIFLYYEDGFNLE